MTLLLSWLVEKSDPPKPPFGLLCFVIHVRIHNCKWQKPFLDGRLPVLGSRMGENTHATKPEEQMG